MPRSSRPDLWRFAVACYGHSGLDRLCLALQDEGMDVCLLLCAAWLEQAGVRCSETRLQALRNIVEPWQREVTTPLRQLRRRWKPAATQDPELAALRQRLQQLELDSERTLLQRLSDATGDWPGADRAQAGWLEALGLASRQAALAHLREAARACFTAD